MHGWGIGLVPLQVEHAAELATLIDAHLWAGMTTPFPRTAADYAQYARLQIDAPNMLAFAITDAATGELRGSTSFYDLSLQQGRVEIGSTWYARQFWGGNTNPAAKMLLFSHAFETLALTRVALRCDARNTRSARAILRLGATSEGVLRSHRLASDGTRGNTAYFSVLHAEWPAVKAGLAERLRGA
nr:GNAT family protein [Leifsonia psychrotolerans]